MIRKQLVKLNRVMGKLLLAKRSEIRYIESKLRCKEIYEFREL